MHLHPENPVENRKTKMHIMHATIGVVTVLLLGLLAGTAIIYLWRQIMTVAGLAKHFTFNLPLH